MDKPTCVLSGVNGNVFNLVTHASKALKDAGLKGKSDEMIDRIFNTNSYEEALKVIGEYVEIE
jgi:hypothetical protein